MGKITVGVLGCGVISEIYLKNLKERFRNIEVVGCADALRNIEVVGCADALPEKARERATQFGVTAFTVDELLAHPGIKIILNLTIPAAHGEMSMKVLNAGKHVYSEKPLATDTTRAKAILDVAKSKGLLVGCAPDTFLGAGAQTGRKLLDDGWIGEPIGATAYFLSRGPEYFHPNPAFLYQEGAGPLFDMGPYYLTAMINLLGPVAKVGGFARKIHAQKMKMRPDNYGQMFDVEVPTYVNGSMEFSSGVIGSLTTSFDLHYPYSESPMPFIQIFGTEGTLTLPDPNKFDGPVMIRRSDGENAAVPLTHGFTENCRGMGLSDMAHAVETGEKHRASGALAYHVLEVMSGILDAAAASTVKTISGTCERPAPLPRVLPTYL
ncbi:MAG: Gfo/Idh/MocA family oxidoreductase [Treponemataceae bacterium]